MNSSEHVTSLLPRIRFAVGTWTFQGGERWLGFLLASVILCIAAARIDTSHEYYALDFRLLWLAGRAWGSMQSPYGTAFGEIYVQMFGEQPSWHLFNYPPYFVFVSVPLSWMSFEWAMRVWTVISLVCVAVSSYLLVSVSTSDGKSPWLPVVFVLIYTVTNQGFHFSLNVGQTSMVMLLAASLFVYGYSYKAPIPLVFSLVIFSLKPNLGLVPGLVILSQVYNVRMRMWQRWALYPVVVSGVFVAVGTVVAVLLGGENTVVEFIENVRHYSEAEPCTVYNLTGPPHLFSTFLDAPFPLIGCLFLCLVVTSVLVWKQKDEKLLALGIVAAVMFFIPLHTYDMVAAAALVPLLWNLSRSRAVLAGVGLILLHRCSNLEPGLDERTMFAGTCTATIAALLLLLVSCEWKRRGAHEMAVD